MNVEVKWGVITLVKQTMDLCEQIENVDLKCPLEKGQMVLTKQVDLPKQIPPVSLPTIKVVYSYHTEDTNCLSPRVATLCSPMSTPRMRRRSPASRPTISSSRSSSNCCSHLGTILRLHPHFWWPRLSISRWKYLGLCLLKPLYASYAFAYVLSRL